MWAIVLDGGKGKMRMRRIREIIEDALEMGNRNNITNH
jgi:hypothetical protein